MTAPQPLTPAEIEAIEARAEAATPGPWFTSPAHRKSIARVSGPAIGEAYTVEDAAFIAAARADVLRLLAHARAVEEWARAVEAERDALEFALRNVVDYIEYQPARSEALAALAARRTR